MAQEILWRMTVDQAGLVDHGLDPGAQVEQAVVLALQHSLPQVWGHSQERKFSIDLDLVPDPELVVTDGHAGTVRIRMTAAAHLLGVVEAKIVTREAKVSRITPEKVLPLLGLARQQELGAIEIAAT
jgi:predicted ribonuclease YlaK